MIFVVLAKVRAPRGRGVGEPSHPPEIRYESRAINPFPIYGGRLGWGRAALKRGFGGSEFKREPTPISPSWEKVRMGVSRASSPRPAARKPLPLQALYRGRLRWARGARKRDSAGGTPALPRKKPSPSLKSRQAKSGRDCVRRPDSRLRGNDGGREMKTAPTILYNPTKARLPNQPTNN